MTPTNGQRNSARHRRSGPGRPVSRNRAAARTERERGTATRADQQTAPGKARQHLAEGRDHLTRSRGSETRSSEHLKNTLAAPPWTGDMTTHQGESRHEHSG